MTSFHILVSLYSIRVDSHINKLARSSDPRLRKMLTEEVRKALRSQKATEFRYSLGSDELNRYAREYGEQYTTDACADLNQYFDIINRRFFSRTVPTQLAVLYLFGSGKQYRPSVGAISAAGEGVAGYCMEQFGYHLLVRPLGIMPDAVHWTTRSDRTHIALAEAKASTTGQNPSTLLEKHVFQFFVDIKTRAIGFTNPYEGYLICSQFRDGGEVECVCLHVDLEFYLQTPGPAPLHISTLVAPPERPKERVRDLVRLQAEVFQTRDQYLTELISEEATRAATLTLLKENAVPDQAQDVENYIRKVATEEGLAEEWRKSQELIKEIKSKEEDVLNLALERYRRPDVDLDQ